MNDAALFSTFLSGPLGLTVARTRNEVTDFIGTFNDLLSTSEKEIDDFVKTVHASNSARPANAKMVIKASVITGLKSLLYELKDRELCGALPDHVTLSAIDAAQLALLRNQRNIGLDAEKMRRDVSLPDMEVPKLTNSNFDDFNTAFVAVVSRQTSRAGIALDYLLREDEVGNYNAVYSSREEKLKACMELHGTIFREDSEAVYSLLVQHVGTTGTGSNIVRKYQTSKNGRSCYTEIKNHFQNASYKENLASAAENKIRDAKYYGDRRNFTLETYYTLMTGAFNDLELAGTAHALTEEQKITKFESGLVDDKAIDYSIQAKEKWDLKPLIDQTFDAYYNDFSAAMAKRNNLSNRSNNQGRTRVRIAQIGSNRNNDRSGGRGRGGRNYNSRGRGRGRGSYRGRGRGAYHPYQLARNYVSNFTPEARVYASEEFKNLTRQQKQQITDLKASQGWIDGNTPPPGFVLDSEGRPSVSTHIVSAVQASIANTNTTTLPPAPVGENPPVPPVINTIASTAGQSFGRRGSRQPPASDDNASIASVSIVNGRQYRGQVFDANGNPLN